MGMKFRPELPQQRAIARLLATHRSRCRDVPMPAYRPHLPRILPLVALVAMLALLGCESDPALPVVVVGKTEVPPSAAVPCPIDPTLHTAPCLQTEADALQLASKGGGSWPAAKFVIGRFSKDSGPNWFLDPSIYAMHDEWYWFRLMNGYAVDGDAAVPQQGLILTDLPAAYAWAKAQKSLPYGLDWYETRLYSRHFYDMASFCWEATCPPRTFGVGTLFHLVADPKRPYPQALWAFDLEYPDQADTIILQHYFDRLQRMLPPEIFAQLHWVAQTSSQQMALASKLRSEKAPLAARVLTWPDLVAPGKVEGYTLGVTAGKVRKLTVGQADSVGLEPTDLAVLPDVPLSMPPVAGVLTAVPQTPQAHLNLLSAARGTPNAFVAGIIDDKVLDLWSKEHAWVALEVTANSVRWKQLQNSQVSTWLSLNAPQSVSLAMANLEGAPAALALTGGSVALSRAWLPLIGGKAMGLMALASLPGLETPPQVAVITVLGYAKHMAPLQPLIYAMLDDTEFKANKLARELLLEGPTVFAGNHSGDPAGMAFWHEWQKSAHSAAATQLVAAGGLTTLVREQPLDPVWWLQVDTFLKQRFRRLDHHQALRLRSSSTAEDIDGFNGAGVYISVTGFLYADEQAKKSDRALTVPRAITAVYASYWGSQAVEERILAGIDHLQGRMAMAVHPRFDNDVESANGVGLLTLARTPQGNRIELTVDAQPGSLSVTNPPEGVIAQPEIDRITQIGLLPPQLVRLQLATTETTGPGGFVLSDDELATMFAQVVPLAGQWLDVKYAQLAADEKGQSVQLDFEFRRVDAGWPLLANGLALPPRLVWKQVRSLEHVGTVHTEALEGALVPRDVLHAAIEAWQQTCKTPAFTAVFTELYTTAAGPSAGGVPLTDYATKPFTARMQLQLHQFIGGLPPGISFDASHTAVQFSHPATTSDHWDLRVDVPPVQANKWGWQQLTADQSGSWSIAAGLSKVQGKGAVCSKSKLLAASKDSFLKTILSQP